MVALMDDTDARLALVRSAQAGDRHAFKNLVNRYRRRIEGLIATRVRVRGMKDADLDEALQETLRRAYRGLGSFPWEGRTPSFAGAVALRRT